MLSITAPTRSPTSWTPAVPPPACDTIGELLETQEHFSSTPTPWNSKQARPAGLACLQYQNKCFRLLCDRCRGVHPVFVATFWIRMSRPPRNCTGLKYFPKKEKSLCAQSCMAGSAFLLNIPPISFFAFQIEKSEPRGNVTKNRRFIKNSFDVLLLFRFKVGHQMTPNGKPSSKLKIPCANNTCGFDPAQQGSNQPCGLLLSARETPTTGIASSSKSKGFGLLFFFCSVSYTLVFSGKMRNHFQLLTR